MAAPRRSDRWPRPRKAVVLLVSAALLRAPASGVDLPRALEPVLAADDAAAEASGAALEPSVPADGVLEGLLTHARRSERETSGGDAFRTVASAGRLWTSRARLARAAAALAELDGKAAREAASPADDQLLALDGLDEWIELSIAPGLPLLLDFAGRARLEPLERVALSTASRLARTVAEKSLVLAAWGAWRADAPATPRAEIAHGLSRARLLEEPAAGTALVELATLHPDAPERAPDLFDELDRRAFAQAVKRASAETRLFRARKVAPRQPDEALALVLDLADSHRAELADLYLVTGRSKEAKKLLLGLTAPGADGVHVDVLRALADMRDALTSPPRPKPAPRRNARGKPSRTARRPSPPAPRSISPDLDARLGAEVDRLLRLELAESDRRRLLAEAVRFELSVKHRDHARGHLEALLSASPNATAGADELFAEAFGLFRLGTRPDLDTAARLLEEQAALYRDVMVRRRAVYWAGRARAAAGRSESAKALYASLLSGPSPDLYGVWGASEMRVTLQSTAASEPAEHDDPLRAEIPAAASRELLACGFPGLAEDAAEVEGSLDALFGAALASERDDHRRAASLLKQRWPELGTPEEGAVPLAARRAFYPLAHSELVGRAAREHGVAPSLLFALIRQESLFQPFVTSRAGAVGLMQVMPATGRHLLRKEGKRGPANLDDPAENVRLGASYLAYLLRLYGGDEIAALAAYNAGPGRVARWRREQRGAPPDVFLESMPMKEPRDYVKRVLYYQGAYAALYGLPLSSDRPVEVRPPSL